MRLGIPCNDIAKKLICKECQIAKIACPRRFDNIVRVLANKLRESEDEVRSKYTRLMVPSAEKGKEKKGNGGGAKAKARAKKSKANGDARKTKGKGKEQEELPKIVIPGRPGGPSSETRSERSDSRAPCDDNKMANEEELEMDVNVPGTSKPQPQCSHSQLLHPSGNPIVDEDGSLSQIPAEVPGMSASRSRHSDLQARANDNPTANEEIPPLKIAVDILESSKSQPRRSHLQVPHADDIQSTNKDDNSGEMHVDRALLTPKSSHSLSQTPDISLDSKRKMWDDLSRMGLYKELEAYEARQTLSRQQLDDVTSTKDVLAAQLSELRGKAKDVEAERDDALYEVQALSVILEDLRAEQQKENEGLDEESELSQLRRKVKSLEDERDALKETHRLMDVLKGPNQFEWGAPSLPWPVQNQGHYENVSYHQHSSLGAQPNSQGENPGSMTALKEALVTRIRLFSKEKNQREELEKEVVVLRSELGKIFFLSGGGLVFLQCIQGRLVYILTCFRTMGRSHGKSGRQHTHSKVSRLPSAARLNSHVKTSAQ